MKSMNYSKVRIMQKERDPLNLGSLPAIAPPADGWPAIRAELERHRHRRRFAVYIGSGLSVAAALMLAVGTYIQQPGPAPAQVAAPVTAQAEAPQPVDSLVALSRQLENQVREFRAGLVGLPTESLVYQVELEDMIAQVDEELSMSPESTELWSQRVNLLLDLSRLYENQLRREYHQIASL